MASNCALRAGSGRQSSPRKGWTSWPPISASCISVPIVLAMAKPSSGDVAPAQASAEYQPIELPVTATISTRSRSIARKSPSVAA